MQLCIRAIDAMSVYVTSYVVPVIYSPVFSRRFADILGLENLESRNTDKEYKQFVENRVS